VTNQFCEQSHYAAIVDAQKDVEIYQRGDVECASCLQRMVEKHEALAQTFRERLAAITDGKVTSAQRALCHECSEMVEVVAGKLAPHHGVSGDGCPLNDAVAQIYLHPRVVDRIAGLEADLVFGGARWVVDRIAEGLDEA